MWGANTECKFRESTCLLIVPCCRLRAAAILAGGAASSSSYDTMHRLRVERARRATGPADPRRVTGPADPRRATGPADPRRATGPADPRFDAIHRMRSEKLNKYLEGWWVTE